MVLVNIIIEEIKEGNGSDENLACVVCEQPNPDKRVTAFHDPDRNRKKSWQESYTLHEACAKVYPGEFKDNDDIQLAQTYYNNAKYWPIPRGMTLPRYRK
jgi:hypothetical protein